MKFEELAKLFEKLESTSKRLEKILILRDFIQQNQKEGPLIFDMIAGNYQREISKKSIGISLKTIFSVLSFISKKNETTIEKEFNKVGDIGQIAVSSLSGAKQSSLATKELELKDITSTFENIKETTGTNSNKIKKERLTKLFLSASTELEYKFLARLLIDDLRIGVSEGVLKEAYINYFFPKIKGIHNVCQSCHYVNLNNERCIHCSEKVDVKNQEEIAEKAFDLIENDKIEKILYIKDRNIIEVKEPRDLYNKFIQIFERKYNVTISFRKIDEDTKKKKENILDAKITLFNPLKSMLGVRATSVEEALDVVGEESMADYKYDGLRVQIHNEKGKVKLFSRNLDDITKQFPEVVQFVKDNFSDVSFVMDSECVGYDFDKQQFLPFQMLSRRILTKDVKAVSHIKVVVKTFDIMYLDKETLLDRPYKERREIMQNLFIGRPLKQDLSFDTKKLINSK